MERAGLAVRSKIPRIRDLTEAEAEEKALLPEPEVERGTISVGTEGWISAYANCPASKGLSSDAGDAIPE